MAIFNLTDIIFSKTGERPNGQLEDIFKKTLSPKGYTITRYPEELGISPDRMHYIVFHINQQRNTQYKSSTVADSVRSFQNREYISKDLQRGNITPLGTIQQGINTVKSLVPEGVTSTIEGAGNLLGRAGGAVMRGVESLAQRNATTAAILESVTSTARATGQVITKVGSEIANIEEKNFLRTTERTVETIALYMPNTMSYTLNQSYSETNLADIMGKAGALLSAADQVGNQRGNSNLTPFIRDALQTEIAGKIGKALGGINTAEAGKVLQATFGYANNPQVELIYERPSLRDFNFTFAFYPRSKKEAQDIQKIIRLFRFHSAPEIAANFGGRFLIPPSNFDVMFCHNGKENPNIPKISTCVLTSVGVQYFTGSNYEIPVAGNSIEDPTIGGTGMPYQITLSLAFRETEIITKELIDPGQNNQGGY